MDRKVMSCPNFWCPSKAAISAVSTPGAGCILIKFGVHGALYEFFAHFTVANRLTALYGLGKFRVNLLPLVDCINMHGKKLGYVGIEGTHNTAETLNLLDIVGLKDSRTAYWSIHSLILP
jgi:hypothetical protein